MQIRGKTKSQIMLFVATLNTFIRKVKFRF